MRPALLRQAGQRLLRLGCGLRRRQQDAEEGSGRGTALYGEPYKQTLDWATIRGRGCYFDSKTIFGYTLEDHLLHSSGVYAYFLVFWRGDHLPALKTPIAFTDDISSTQELTGDRLNALIHNTFFPPTASTPYLFTAVCGCMGEPSIPGLESISSTFDIGDIVAAKIETHIGRFKV